MRLSETDRLLVSALLPSVEELADHAAREAPYLSPGEAMDVGDLARVMMTEAIEEGADSVLVGADDDDPAPRPFDELLGDLVGVCVAAALKRLGHSSREDSPKA